MQEKGKGISIAALVVGAVSMVFALIPLLGWMSWLFGPVGLILGIIGLTQKQWVFAGIGTGLSLISMLPIQTMFSLSTLSLFYW